MAQSRIGAVCFTVTGLLFAGYPAVRPYSDETTMDGARAIASTAWIASHLLAVAGFVLLGLSLLALRDWVRPGD